MGPVGQNFHTIGARLAQGLSIGWMNDVCWGKTLTIFPPNQKKHHRSPAAMDHLGQGIQMAQGTTADRIWKANDAVVLQQRAGFYLYIAGRLAFGAEQYVNALMVAIRYLST